MIQAVLFDLDDTLLWDNKSVKEAFRATCKIAEEKYGVDPEKLEEAVREEARELYSNYETYEFTKTIGINPFEGLWGDFHDEHHEQFQKMKEIVPGYRKEAWRRGLNRLGVADEAFSEELAEQFPVERQKHPYLYEESLRVLDGLKDDNRLVLLTNGSPYLQNKKLEMTPELVPHFDEIVISGAFGRGKPDPSIFEHTLEKLGIQKEHAVMVGDNLNTDILGATRVGIKAVWINREDKERSEIVPDYEIQHLEELYPILEALNKEEK